MLNYLRYELFVLLFRVLLVEDAVLFTLKPHTPKTAYASLGNPARVEPTCGRILDSNHSGKGDRNAVVDDRRVHAVGVW